MGNFSRNTFDPTKNYVAVRLQQGVPVVDADWNEMNDVARHELYEGLGLAFSDGVAPGSSSLFISPRFWSPESDNEIYLWPGSVLIGGRPLCLRWGVRYFIQPWTDPARAAKDQVDVIPLLTTPKANRDDIVYLDVWEREIGSAEDGDLINPLIKIETCLRLKREVAFRVAEGATTLPPVPAGHLFMPLALLRRQAGQARITDDQIEDIRPKLYGTQGSREVSFFPAFLPMLLKGILLDTWNISYSFGGTIPTPRPKFFALKTQDKAAVGVVPLVLPEGAHMTHLNVRGATTGAVHFLLLRIRHESGDDPTQLYDELVRETVQPVGGEPAFNRSFAITNADRKNIVDNIHFYYCLCAEAPEIGYAAAIHGISIRYGY